MKSTFIRPVLVCASLVVVGAVMPVETLEAGPRQDKSCRTGNPTGINCTGTLVGHVYEDPSLAPGGPQSLLGLSDVTVHVYRLVPTGTAPCAYTESSTQCWTEVKAVTTDVAGYYIVTGLDVGTSLFSSVTYRVEFEDELGCYDGEYYLNTQSFQSATKIALSPLIPAQVLLDTLLAPLAGCREE